MATSKADEKRTKSIIAIAASLSLIEVSILSFFSFFASVTSIDRNFAIFLIYTISTGALGFLGRQFFSKRREFNASEIFQIIALNYGVVIVLCSALYLSLGVSTSFDGALLESVSGLSTTSLTNVVPESLGKSVLLFRSLTQWLGGIGALIMVFVALPEAGRAEEFDVAFAKSFTSQKVSETLLRLAKLYVLLTLGTCVAFVISGMTIFEGLCHSLTSVSSGGFSTKSMSIAGFGSSTIEWVVAIAMFFTGINVVILWWMWKRKFSRIAKNSEFRIYLLLVVTATILFSIWRRDVESFWAVIRKGFFLSSSLLSTTGFTTISWDFPSGMAVIVLLLLGVGAMAGSSGGGYGSARVLQHYRFARRELTQQLKPSSVRVVKISGKVIDERALHRLHGFTAIFISLVGAGAFIIALANPNSTPIEVLSFSLTCLATAGPFIATSPVDSGIEFNTVTHIVSSMLMLLGRLSIFPIAYLGVAFLRTLREGPFRRVRYRAERS